MSAAVLEVRVTDPRLACDVELLITRGEDDGWLARRVTEKARAQAAGITRDVHRATPLTDLVQQAVRCAAAGLWPIHAPRTGSVTGDVLAEPVTVISVDEDDGEVLRGTWSSPPPAGPGEPVAEVFTNPPDAEVLAKHKRSRATPGRPPHSDEHYREVARVVQANPKYPRKAVARHFVVSESQASVYIREARRRDPSLDTGRAVAKEITGRSPSPSRACAVRASAASPVQGFSKGGWCY